MWEVEFSTNCLREGQKHFLRLRLIWIAIASATLQNALFFGSMNVLLGRRREVLFVMGIPLVNLFHSLALLGVLIWGTLTTIVHFSSFVHQNRYF